MKISFYDFASLHNSTFREKAMALTEEILNANSFIDGKYNTLFEEGFSKIQKSKHTLLVANGTDAIEMALVAAGVKAGDYVGIPGITFYATAEAVFNIGCKPVLIDVNPDTGLICPESFKRVLAKHPLKAVVPVHIYGLPAPISEIVEIAKKHQVVVVEDGAQACGTMLDTGPVGSNKDTLVTFSYYPTKNLGALGDAGAITTHNDTWAQNIKILRNHGRGGEGVVGRNSRCDHFQAAYLFIKLETIEKENQTRKQIATQYHNELKDLPIKLLPKKFLPLSSWHLYPIHLSDSKTRAQLAAHLNECGIATAPFYERSMGQELALKNCPGEKSVADNMAGRVLCLPIHPFISNVQIAEIAKSIRNFFKLS